MEILSESPDSGEYVAGEEVLQDRAPFPLLPVKKLGAPGPQDIENDQVSGAVAGRVEGVAAVSGRARFTQRAPGLSSAAKTPYRPT